MKLVRLAVPALVLALAGCGSDSGSKSTSTSVPASAPALQQRLVSVVDHGAPKIVQIETGSGLGSGVVFDDRGDVVTNAHVVGDAHTVRVTQSDGKQVEGQVLGRFAPNDLAVVRAENSTPSLRSSARRRSCRSATSRSPSGTRSACARR